MKADLSIDFSQFNLSKIFDRVQALVQESTGFNIDFELPSLPGSTGTPGGLPPLLAELGSKLNFLVPFLDFNALRDGLTSAYVMTPLSQQGTCTLSSTIPSLATRFSRTFC